MVQISIWMKEEPKCIKKDKIYWWVIIIKAWMIVSLYDLDLFCEAHAWSINLIIRASLYLTIWKSKLSFIDLYVGSVKRRRVYTQVQ